MPLPAPILDNRSWDQLRRELVERIPVYTPEWTDEQVSDPGITLLELFAYLGENLLFRFNQIPETTRLEFLRRLDLPLRPASPSEALVTFSIERGHEVVAQHEREVKAGAIPFEVLTETNVLPVSVLAYARVAADEPGPGDERDYALQAIDAFGLRDGERARYYRGRPLPAEPAKPDARPVDFDEALDGILWCAVVPDKEATVDELRNLILNLGVAPVDEAPALAEVDPCPGRSGAPKRPPVIWEITTGELGDRGQPRYRPLRLIGDTSDGLTRPGVVRLELPKDGPLGNAVPDDLDLAGTGDRPPPLDDEDLEDSVLFWLRAYRRDRGSFGRLLWVGANAAEVRQQRAARPEFLGTGTGDADQRMSLVNRNVVAGSLVVEVEEGDRWVRWNEVDSFAASGPDDRHFVLDPEAGEVQFGAMGGRPPQIGERVRAAEYRYGGGVAGNVGADAIAKIDRRGATLKVRNPLPATGGEDAEPVASALERIPGELRRRDRAVTADDFGELALQVPGAPVVRAECLPRFHPRHTDTLETPGVVSVVVWPREDTPAPLPSKTLLRRVCRALDARRLVTTELYVIPPVYRKIAVSVGVEVAPGFGVEAVRAWVEQILHQYLAPVPPYGPAGGGWPLGRRVYGPELEAAALQVEGVEFLYGLRVSGLEPDGVTWTEGTVTLRRYEVPELAEITVVDGDPPLPGTPLAPLPPDPNAPNAPGDPAATTGVAIPIPRLRREC
jgi:hypothetical protein